MVDYKQLALEARRDVLTMVHKAQTSHIASNFSVIDIASVLYENLEPEDRVVWSKGWAAASVYYFNAKYGRGPQDAVDTFPQEPYFGLAETTVEGVEVNGGSVGHGLSVAVGMALGKKRAGEKGKIYCIMSDGELNEGSVWEAAMVAGHHKLDNLVAIVDANGWQAMGRTEDIASFDERKVFEGFGWYADFIDGHDYQELHDEISTTTDLLPEVYIAKTIKGKGVSFFEDHLTYHYKHVDEADYKKAMAELI